ncbi:MAG: 50S ribosomal protein L11 methyltransferase [Bacteroidetes bacterium]|nr:50S ribosomal protein L11 methyltransferase [Bacteroidota bacterium]
MTKEYIEISFDFTSQDQLGLVIAQLSEMGFDGFNEEQAYCKAYILSSELDKEEAIINLNNIFKQYSLTYSKSIIKEQNWNAVWESNFDPVRVGDFVGIKAHFHPNFEPAVQFEIKITPKMSFGTGHHATTFSVMQMMEHLHFVGKSVYDFGTGTGVLAILAEKLGASQVLAVDNDDWCIENANENIQNNDSKVILVQKVASALQNTQFDIILANVNRHIIEANMQELTSVAYPGSQMILSGLLIDDQQDMVKLATENGWIFVKSQPLNGWVSLLFNLS